MKPHVLFVCGANRLRSPTAEQIYKTDERIEVRSAGTMGGISHQVSTEDLQWADLVLVMELRYKMWIRNRFRFLDLPPIHSLDISDRFVYMDKTLIRLIQKASEPLIEKLVYRSHL